MKKQLKVQKPKAAPRAVKAAAQNGVLRGRRPDVLSLNIFFIFFLFFKKFR